MIADLVVNHTSDEHPWFHGGARGARASPYRDFYVWPDDPADERRTRSEGELGLVTRAGQWYMHQFHRSSPT